MPLNSHIAKRQVQRQIYPDTSCLRIDSNTFCIQESPSMSATTQQHWCIGCWAKLDAKRKNCDRCGREFSSSDPSTYYCRPIGFLTGLDLHVVYLMLMMCPVALFLSWPFGVATLLFLMPQPMIVTRFIDKQHHKPDEKKLNIKRVLVNEACVSFIVTIAYIVNDRI